MRGFIDEVKAAVAGLARAPAFTALAVGVLGLGLGAVIFMYGVADTLMLKPAPYPNGERLYSIVTHRRAGARRLRRPHGPRGLRAGPRERRRQFEAIGAAYVGTAYLTGDGQAERYDGGFADGYMFDVAGVAPEIGRVILPRDATEGAAPVVVLSHTAVEGALRFRPVGHRPHRARERQGVRSHRRDAGGLRLPLRGAALGPDPGDAQGGSAATRPRPSASTGASSRAAARTSRSRNSRRSPPRSSRRCRSRSSTAISR